MPARAAVYLDEDLLTTLEGADWRAAEDIDVAERSTELDQGRGDRKNTRRLPYVRPRLRTYGTIGQLTRASQGSQFDLDGFPEPGPGG